MLIPTQVTFRGLAHSDPIEADIVERVTRLEKFYQGIVSCRVVIEVPHRHRRTGRHFHITIELTVPDGEPIVVSHEPSLHTRLKDVAAAEHQKESETESVHRYARVAVHEAFDAARRRLQDFARRQRGTVKMHAARAPHTPLSGSGAVNVSEPRAFGRSFAGTPTRPPAQAAHPRRRRTPAS